MGLHFDFLYVRRGNCQTALCMMTPLLQQKSYSRNAVTVIIVRFEMSNQVNHVTN